MRSPSSISPRSNRFAGTRPIRYDNDTHSCGRKAFVGRENKKNYTTRRNTPRPRQQVAFLARSFVTCFQIFLILFISYYFFFLSSRQTPPCHCRDRRRQPPRPYRVISVFYRVSGERRLAMPPWNVIITSKQTNDSDWKNTKQNKTTTTRRKCDTEY